MPEILRSDTNQVVEAESLDEEKLKALDDSTRREILTLLAEEPSYPSNIASKLGISKQKAYYHFQKLEDAGLIVEEKEEKKSGGLATFYAIGSGGYVLDFDKQVEKRFIPSINENLASFLETVIHKDQCKAKIVVGSPDQHGEHQVRARDGYLAGEVGAKLGNYGDSQSIETRLDTDIIRDQDFDSNLFLIGGMLTNTVTRKFNEEFSVNFSTENFPYHKLQTPEKSYSEDSIGVIQKIQNPFNPEKSVFMIAGVRSRGTMGAVKAFGDLESIIEDYSEGSFYRVVRALDLDEDGEIDSYEVIE